MQLSSLARPAAQLRLIVCDMELRQTKCRHQQQLHPGHCGHPAPAPDNGEMVSLPPLSLPPSIFSPLCSNTGDSAGKININQSISSMKRDITVALTYRCVVCLKMFTSTQPRQAEKPVPLCSKAFVLQHLQLGRGINFELVVLCPHPGCCLVWGDQLSRVITGVKQSLCANI